MHFFSGGIKYHCTLHISDKSYPHLLLLHGFMGSEKAFNHLIEPLKKFCNPITIDLAGHGETVTPRDVRLFKAENQVAQIQSILNRFSFENLFAYGYSMGGRLLFHLITSHPELFQGAMFESTHCGLSTKEEKLLRVQSDKKRAESILKNFSQFIDEWLELPLFKSTSANQKKAYSELMKQQDPDLIALSLEGFGAGIMPPVCEKLQNLNLPLYLVAGQFDVKYVDIMTKIMNSSKNSSLSIVENAGHRVHIDQPNELINIIQSFIKNHHA
jgi:2-succinyl-6-hydroxy-2,4-cyclohexadiene-1-carboxylate synthase